MGRQGGYVWTDSQRGFEVVRKGYGQNLLRGVAVFRSFLRTFYRKNQNFRPLRGQRGVRDCHNGVEVVREV